MAQTSYDYSISGDFQDSALVSDRLTFEIEDAFVLDSVIPTLVYIGTSGDTATIYVSDPLSGPEKAVLDAVIAAHQYIPSIPLTPEFLSDSDPFDTAYTYAVVRTAGVVTQETWTNNTTGLLAKTVDYMRTLGLVTTEVRKLFAENGIEISAQMTINYTYTNGLLTGATTTRDI